MREDVCRYFNGIGDEGKCCDADISYRDTVGGDDFGWVKRLPCMVRNITDIKCDKLQLPTKEEVEKFKKESQEYMADTFSAIALIMEKHEDVQPEFNPCMNEKKEGGPGAIDCPKCGVKDGLQYTISGGDHHIWGKCKTEGCLQWMM